MELTELSPVRQWARGGELRATGHHRSVHRWAMPTHRGEAGDEEEEQSVSVDIRKALPGLDEMNNSCGTACMCDSAKNKRCVNEADCWTSLCLSLEYSYLDDMKNKAFM